MRVSHGAFRAFVIVAFAIAVVVFAVRSAIVVGIDHATYISAAAFNAPQLICLVLCVFNVLQEPAILLSVGGD